MFVILKTVILKLIKNNFLFIIYNYKLIHRNVVNGKSATKRFKDSFKK